MDIINHNKSAWDNYVDKKDRWTIPVSEQELENVKKGTWNIVLTASKSVPHDWFPNLKGLKILGLACGGGQQGPILASLGSDVTIFDTGGNVVKTFGDVAPLIDQNLGPNETTNFSTREVWGNNPSDGESGRL